MVKMITSKQNALIKEIRSLSDKKYRDKLGVFVVEGIKPVKEAIELGLNIRDIVGTEKGLINIDLTGFCVQTVTEDVFKWISEEVTPQGVLAVVFKPENNLLPPVGSALLLDGVSDPSNVGAIIRTAAAAGYNYIYTTPDCADPYSQKAVRSSMTGVFRVRVMRADLDSLLDVINIPLVVADMDGESVFNLTVDCAHCLVIGSEGHGVSDKVLSNAEYVVKIPMENGVESLNAAVSAGILMYSLKK